MNRGIAGLALALLLLSSGASASRQGSQESGERYRVPDAEWNRLFASPNRTPEQSARAWEPVARAVQKVIAAMPADAGYEALYREMRLGPTGYENGPRLGVFTSSVPIRQADGARRLEALVVVAATMRTPNGRAASRHAAILVTHAGSRWRHQVVTHLLPFEGGPTNEGAGMRSGRWITLATTDWHRRLDAGYGPAWAVVFRDAGRQWKLVAKRQTNVSGAGAVARGPAAPDAIISLFSRRGESIVENSEIPALAVKERWRLSHGSLRTISRHAVPNQYWAVDGLITALRRGDLKTARKYVVSESVLQDAVAAGLAGGAGPWGVTQEGDQNEIGLQAGKGTGDQFRAAGIRFTRVGEEERIRLIINYMPKRRQEERHDGAK